MSEYYFSGRTLVSELVNQLDFIYIVSKPVCSFIFDQPSLFISEIPLTSSNFSLTADHVEFPSCRQCNLDFYTLLFIIHFKIYQHLGDMPSFAFLFNIIVNVLIIKCLLITSVGIYSNMGREISSLPKSNKTRKCSSQSNENNLRP